ncbi:MAG: hypothetical protein AAF481_15605 [Acidobacteriota bacterium]
MNEARRTLRSWLLLALLEKGCGATRDLPPRRPARVRPLSEFQRRQLAGSRTVVSGDRARETGGARVLTFPRATL